MINEASQAGFGLAPEDFDPVKAQNGRRRNDLLLRPRAEVLRFGTSLWNGDTLAEIDIHGPKATDEVPLS